MRPGHRLRCGDDHRPRLPPVRHARSAGRGRAPRARRSGTPTGGRTSTRPAARSSSTSATAGARSPRRWPSRPAAWPTPTAARSRPNRSSGTRRRSAAHLPLDGAVDLSRVRRVGGDRDRAEAGPGLPHRARRAGSLDRVRAVGELPRQHARARSTCPDASRSAARTRAGSGGSGTCRRRIRTVPATPGANARATGDELAAGARGGDRGGRARDRRRVRRRADRRARRWPRPCRPTTTGRRSPTSAGATACCSSPTRS